MATIHTRTLVVQILISVLACSLAQAQDREVSDSPGVVMRMGATSRVVPRIAARFRSADVVRWEGAIQLPYSGDYRFAVEFQGRLRVEVGSETLLEGHAEAKTWTSTQPAALESGNYPLTISLEPTSASAPSSLVMFWQGPGFRFEPIPATQLRHAALDKHEPSWTMGQSVARVLRCQGCHEMGGLPSRPLAAPSLSEVGSTLRASWLRSFLSESDEAKTVWQRVHGRFDEQEVRQIMAYLDSLSTQPPLPDRGNGDAELGRDAFLTKGCIACHQHNGLGTAGWFTGGDLSTLNQKRPPGFVLQWLKDPTSLNANHRMPRFVLSSRERQDLEAFLLGASGRADTARNLVKPSDVTAGKQLVDAHRCHQCHEAGDDRAAAGRIALTQHSDWDRSCLVVTGKDGQPSYQLDDEQQASVRRFAVQTQLADELQVAELRVEEHNCLGCHPRHSTTGLSKALDQVGAMHPELLLELAKARPPSLNGVGDKLRDDSLLDILLGEGKPRREWLAVQMPHFGFSRDEASTIADYFATVDRVPAASLGDDLVVEPIRPAKGLDRLVTADGFGCTSCHRLGKVEPPSATPVNQLGPDLSLIGRRVRRTWFERWVRNPARIVPKMEMPSVQVAIPNVLEGDLDRQLDAVWHLLNQRGFIPPDPNPTRVVSHSGEASKPPLVLTDVLQFGDQKLVKPFLIGLPNRRNVLFDLAQGRLAGWWGGDVAQQRTQGKTWYWQAPFFGLHIAHQAPEFVLRRHGHRHEPRRHGQFVTEADAWRRIPQGIELRHRLRFATSESSDGTTIRLRQRIRVGEDGWVREIEARGLGADDLLIVRRNGLSTNGGSGGELQIRPSSTGVGSIELRYQSDEEPLPPTRSPDPPKAVARELAVMPGFRVTQLPLPTDVMPTSLSWTPSGQLVLASLKGRVWRASDLDGDGLEDHLEAVSDDLAAPYGLHAESNYIDVVNKYGLIRLVDENDDGITDAHQTVASGWGHTDDYHDWVVGLPRDEEGNYYVAIPCQQDEREPAAAYLRGRVLRLSPRDIDADHPRRFALHEMSGGHRFPMGIARNRAGKLFVTDNQGNYNPFNELNHVIEGARYGFINRLERQPDFEPSLTEPAIDIPHPWTRSVNGICFLETPPNQESGFFGPFEGHLLGCEYDTRRLIRMSVEEVDGWTQGAAYPFAIAAEQADESLQGPINCGVAPDGAIYVANIRDSGWGGANNTGSLVRIEPEFETLPAGIAEVSARSFGFRIRFTKPIARSRAEDIENYTIESYRRVSTPAYGGDDVDRRTEEIVDLRATSESLAVDLVLRAPRRGFVHAIRVRNLTPEKPFFPSEAYYTLRRIPK